MQQNRRTILKAFALLPALPLISSFIGRSSSADTKTPPDYKLVSINDPIPKGLQYNEDASKAAARTDKTANCKNCKLYGKTHPEFKHPKDGMVATCDTFDAGNGKKLYVKSTGWCIAHQK